MNFNRLLFLLLGFAVGIGLTVLYFKNFDPDPVLITPPPAIDSTKAMVLFANYKKKIDIDTCDRKYSIVISKEQFDALKATETLLTANNKLTQVSGYRIFYGTDTLSPQTIKSFVFPMSNKMQYFNPNKRVYVVDLTNDNYSLPCPKFCN